MTSGSTASVAQIVHDAGLAIQAAVAGHHYHSSVPDRGRHPRGDGLATIGAGLVPGNVNMPLHEVAALGILWGGIGALLVGSALWNVTRWQAAGFLAVGAPELRASS
jgi:hypothetical protein